MHLALKHAARLLAIRIGFAAVASEVRCPLGKYRIDIAGYATDIWRITPAVFCSQNDEAEQSNEQAPDRVVAIAHSPPRKRASKRRSSTLIVECKASRADFLRDSRSIEQLQEERRQLEAAQRKIEVDILRTNDPFARCAEESLFSDLDAWDFSRCTLRSYLEIVEELERVHLALFGQTKFQLLARYALADRLFVAAPRGLIAIEELPRGWGLMEFWNVRTGAIAIEGLDQASVLYRVKGVESPQSREGYRQRLLRGIAIAATREVEVHLRRASADTKRSADEAVSSERDDDGK